MLSESSLDSRDICFADNAKKLPTLQKWAQKICGSLDLGSRNIYFSDISKNSLLFKNGIRIAVRPLV